MHIFHMFSYKSLASGALILEILVIADNKHMDFFADVTNIFHIFPSMYNTKLYRDTNRE